MKQLISRAAPSVIQTVGEETYRNQLGMLLTPRGSYSLKLVLKHGASWAADNEAYSSFRRDKFIAMLKRYQGIPGCLFVAAPDVVANAEATMLRFRIWQPVIKHFGYPVALVAQDGLESLPIDWNAFEALFIGGSTIWKMGEMAAALIGEAKRRGKHVHMGRVNSNIRIQYASAIGCDSADGTNYSKFTHASLPKAIPALKSYTLPLWEGLKCA